MNVRTLVRRTLGAGVVVGAALLVLGQLLGQPILLGYVATGSMEPVLSAGDGFVAIPSAVAGEVEEGDVVVFDARELHGGGLTTHRVVGETEAGYVTAGDANPFADQDGDEPPVTDDRIVAVALRVNGDVVTIPHVGTAATTVRGALESGDGRAAVASDSATGFDGTDAPTVTMPVALGAALIGSGLLLRRRGSATRDVGRSRTREGVVPSRTLLAVALLVFLTLATAAMTVPAATLEYEVAGADGADDLPPGESLELSQDVENAGLLPVLVAFEPEDERVNVDPDRTTVGSRDDRTVAIVLDDLEDGKDVRRVGVHRYLAVLPPSVLASLHATHPIAAIAGVNAVVAGATVATVLAVFGTGDVRLRSVGEQVPASVRLRRKVRRWRRSDQLARNRERDATSEPRPGPGDRDGFSKEGGGR